MRSPNLDAKRARVRWSSHGGKKTPPRYRCTKVYGDNYGGEWPKEQFRRCGLNYEKAGKRKSELYCDLLPLINSGAADLLDNPTLVTQLCLLERKTTRGGRDVIDHPPGRHDDVANAVAGALSLAMAKPQFRAQERQFIIDDKFSPLNW